MLGLLFVAAIFFLGLLCIRKRLSNFPVGRHGYRLISDMETSPIRYTPEGNYPLNCLISHHIFGTGQVIKHIPPNKIHVKFGEEVKYLVCAKFSNFTKESDAEIVKPLPYSPYIICKVGDIIDHRDFGIGKVTNYLYPDKIDVEFPIGIKRITCGKIKQKITNINVSKNNDTQIAQEEKYHLEYYQDKLYPLGCIIKHNTLGIGEVIKYRNTNEIDVKFITGVARLRCGTLPDSLSEKYSSCDSHENNTKNLDNFSIDVNDKLDIFDNTHRNIHAKNEREHSKCHNELTIAGLDPNNVLSKEALQRHLSRWNYDAVASAHTAYRTPSIERLQLLRQIAGLLQNGMGFSQLFDMLEPRRGLPTRVKANAIGKTLQPWSGLSSSVSLRSFVKDHEKFLGGRVVSGKWESNESELDNSIGKIESKLPPLENIQDRHSTDNTVLSHGAEAHRDVSTRNEQDKVSYILTSKFKSGYRISSTIDFERFKTFYADEYGEKFNYSSQSLNILIISAAMIFDDRAYVYDAGIIDDVRAYLNQMSSPVISIDIFFEKFSEELYSFSIFSADMLKSFIENNYPDFSCKGDYIYLQPEFSAASLIREAFNEREIWSFEELAGRLPSLKQDTIQQVLNGTGYCRLEAGVYTHIDNMDLPDKEGGKISAYVQEKLKEKSYVIANELDLSIFENLNPHCSHLAIWDAVFNKFLSSGYRKSGQIITRIGQKFAILDILEEYCRGVETVSFAELQSFASAFDPNGNPGSQYLVAAHNVLVRVSHDLFVSEDKVNFDISKIDEIISSYCKDNYFVSLKNIADLSLFPYTGYPWNLFLLESYVRKFSKSFKYDTFSVSSTNSGVIVSKSFAYTEYDDIIAIALAQSQISIEDKKAVDNFLFANGYIGRKNLGKRKERIIAQAKELREIA